MSLSKILLLLLAGILSVFYAEVLAGSSILWFTDLFGYIFLLPLYMFHLIVLFNIAVRINRLSPRSLYLFGVIFGLYETWMTKVAWAGFSDSGTPILGTLLGFAIAEMSIVSFVWHPFMSFIAPLVTIRILSIHIGNKDDTDLGVIDLILAKNKSSLILYYFLAFFAGGALALNSGGNIIVSALGFFGTLLMIAVIYFILKKMNKEIIKLDNLIIGKKGMILMISYLLFLHVLFFVSIRPSDIPGLLTMILTIGLYALIAIGIYLDKNELGDKEIMHNELFSSKELLRFYALIYLIVVIFSILGELAFILIVIMFLIMIVLGIGTLVFNLTSIINKKIHS